MNPNTNRMRELDFFIGGWTADGQFHETPFGPGKPIEMRITGTADEGGRWITVRVAELPTPQNPDPLSARYIYGYDQVSDEFVAEWFDSNGGRATQRSKGWTGDRLEFLGTITLNGMTVPLRDTFTRHGNDAYYHIGEIELGDGWVAVDDEEAIRQA